MNQIIDVKSFYEDSYKQLEEIKGDSERADGFVKCMNIALKHVINVPNGYWIDEGGCIAKCSLCGHEMDVYLNGGYYKYCPHCGASMHGEGVANDKS